jgi:hypothetical protein
MQQPLDAERRHNNYSRLRCAQVDETTDYLNKSTTRVREGYVVDAIVTAPSYPSQLNLEFL